MRADIETRRCARTNRETMQVMLSSGDHRFPLPPATLIVPLVVAVVTFLLSLL